MSRVILHADLNNFYASVACLNRPALREVPVAVCGDPTLRHGIVLAKNMPAKRLGIQTGQVIWQAKQLCPSLVTLAPDFNEVLRLSHQVRDIFCRYTNRVQSFGVDEAWLDLSQPDMSLAKGEQIANHLRHTVREETGLTVSVGVSDNRIFAKLGSDLKKPDAVSLVCEANRASVLDPLPVSELLFIGRATTRKLNAVGIYTVGQLAAVQPGVLKGLFGKTGLMLSGFAHGDDAAAVLESNAVSKVKSVGNSVTAAHDVRTYHDARITLYGLCESVASRLRKQGLQGGVLQLSLRDTALQTIQRQCTLKADTDSDGAFFEAAFALLCQNWNAGEPLRSLGVSISHLSAAKEQVQLSFLPEEAARQKRAVLERTVDGIRDKYGHFAIGRAVMLYDPALGDINPEEEHVIHPQTYW
ncbi:MAG: DNA polymerase IV [Clostridia bacterium]